MPATFGVLLLFRTLTFLALGFLFLGCLQPSPAPAATTTPSPSSQATLAPAFPSVVFHTARGNFTLSVEIADSPEEYQRGLMNRTSLAQDAGMLFIFPEEQPRYFWMKDTPLPLDIIFISGSGRVVNMTLNATPCFEQQCPFYLSGAPARYVVETNAGYAQRIGLRIGNRAGISGAS